MAAFRCDQCGWSGDDPIHVLDLYLCRKCSEVVAQDVDREKADKFVKELLAKMEEHDER